MGACAIRRGEGLDVRRAGRRGRGRDGAMGGMAGGD